MAYYHKLSFVYKMASQLTNFLVTYKNGRNFSGDLLSSLYHQLYFYI